MHTAMIDDDCPIACSEVVEFESEWRCFVLEGRVLDVRRYKGTFRSSVDLGVLTDGRTAIVEVNDGYSRGCLRLGRGALRSAPAGALARDRRRTPELSGTARWTPSAAEWQCGCRRSGNADAQSRAAQRTVHGVLGVLGSSAKLSGSSQPTSKNPSSVPSSTVWRPIEWSGPTRAYDTSGVMSVWPPMTIKRAPDATRRSDQ
jgi:hypothetical protein